MKQRSGFSIIELILGMLLLSFVGLIVYNMFATGIILEEKSSRIHAFCQDARASFSLLSQELENAFEYDFESSYPNKKFFEGASDRVLFMLPTSDGIDMVEYELMGENLVRTAYPFWSYVEDLAKGKESQIIASGLKEKSLKLLYTGKTADGKSIPWQNSWKEDVLPSIVRLELAFGDQDRPELNGVVLARDIVLPVATGRGAQGPVRVVPPGITSIHTENVRYLKSIKELKQ